jgi:hypothetical protein
MIDKTSMIHIPETPAEFLPPKASSKIAEMRSLLRNPEHWAEVLPYLKALAGETASINGSANYDEAGCVFAVKEICQLNGYTLLANAKAAEISRIFKFAYKGVAGQSVRLLRKQGSQLRLELKQSNPDAEATD